MYNLNYYNNIFKFCKKQNIEFDHWVNGIVGGIAYFDNLYLSIEDIFFDLKTKTKKGIIIEWYNFNLNSTNQITYIDYLKNLKK